MKPYRVPQIAQQYTNYDMIQRHTELPPFSDARGALLYTFLSCGAAGGTPEAGELAELYSLVTSLVQLGLDTHEEIERPSPREGEAAMRSRQLKVLAGDYFSSWFYRLLAQKGQIAMVGTLSEAIAAYNVKKAEWYGKNNARLAAEARIEAMTELNMALFQAFTPLIEAPLRELWLSLLRELSLCEALIGELGRRDESGGANAGTRGLGSEDLHASGERIAALVASVPYEPLRGALGQALGAFISQPMITGQAAGEA